MKKMILLTAYLLCSIVVHAVTVYVGGSGASLPTPWPPRGNLVGLPQYMASGSSSEYIYCIGSSVKAKKYTEYTCRVRCDYYYEYVDGYTSLGQAIIYRKSGTEYYDVDILPVNITNVPSSMTMNIGDQKRIDWSYSPSNVSKPDVEWSTSDYSVAYVNSSDYIVAKGSGIAYIKGKNNAGPDVEIKVTVNDVPVTAVTIENPISVLADQSKTLPVTATPSNATIKTQEWTSADPAVASIDRITGRLTGVWPGTTKVWCVVNGTVKSNEAEVTVTEPSFRFEGFSLQNNATEIETLPTITAEFSHTLSRGDHYNDITLTDDSGQKVDGTVSISGTMLTYIPAKHLQPLTRHTLTIPAGAVKNKWGTGNSAAQTLSFTTTDWQRMTLTVQPEGKYIAPGEQIVLTCSEAAADIFYSTDGSEPSQRYTGPLTFATDMTLRAVAKLDGYYDSPLQHEYIKTVEIVEKFPSEEPLYIYGDVNPSITYSDGIAKGSAFNSITLKKDGLENVGYVPFIQGKTLFLVPNEPLELGCVYTIDMPEGALVTEKGEESQALDWHFNTGFFATAVSAGGPELMAALMTDHSLWTWGRRLTEANAEDGSYSYTTQKVPAGFVSGDVVAVSSGYMHHAIVKRDGSLWMWGRQLCGEFGNGTTAASAQPVKVMDDVKSVSCGLQNTAVVKQDGTLWMCGRNDLGQIDDTRTVHTSYIKIADGVSQATLHWGSLDIVKSDGTTTNRTWDENADSNREPSSVSIDNVADVFYGWKNAIALKNDGSVWTWGTGNPLSEVIEGRNPQPLEGITLFSKELSMAKNVTAVIAHRPMPLLANYDKLEWHSDNEAVATVSNRGVVTTHDDGVAIVTATISDAWGHKIDETCKVTVGTGQGISDALVDTWQLHVVARNQQLIVSGVPEGQTVMVCTASGTILWQGVMHGNQLTVPVNRSGIYMVRSARQVRKVMVR